MGRAARTRRVAASSRASDVTDDGLMPHPSVVELQPVEGAARPGIRGQESCPDSPRVEPGSQRPAFSVASTAATRSPDGDAG